MPLDATHTADRRETLRQAGNALHRSLDTNGSMLQRAYLDEAADLLDAIGLHDISARIDATDSDPGVTAIMNELDAMRCL